MKVVQNSSHYNSEQTPATALLLRGNGQALFNDADHDTNGNVEENELTFLVIHSLKERNAKSQIKHFITENKSVLRFFGRLVKIFKKFYVKWKFNFHCLKTYCLVNGL
jgi:hypothetical protein